MKNKKYWYHVSLSAEGDATGWVQLTEEQAETVAYATNTTNWSFVCDEGWSGSFFIDLASKCDEIPEDNDDEEYD